MSRSNDRTNVAYRWAMLAQLQLILGTVCFFALNLYLSLIMAGENDPCRARRQAPELVMRFPPKSGALLNPWPALHRVHQSMR
jgi:hypothetical protein